MGLPPREGPARPPPDLGPPNLLGAPPLVRLGGGGISDVVNCMFIARPSNGTPLYCFIALIASLLRSNMTSAVPNDLPDLS